MTSNKVATVFRWAAALGFFLTAAGHASAYGKMSYDPSIWFCFSFQQLALGLLIPKSPEPATQAQRRQTENDWNANLR